MKTCTTIIFIFSIRLSAFQSVDVNLASAEQIALLPGVGMRLAENITAQRKKIGAFGSANDLAPISGMTSRKLDQIRDHIIFGRRSKKAHRAIITELPPPKAPLNSAPIIEYSLLEARALALHGLTRDHEDSLRKRVRRAAWLPQISTYFDTDHGEIATRKALSDPVSTRGGRDFGFGVKAQFDFDKLIFNSHELDVAKFALRRQASRDKLADQLRKHYFRYRELAATLVTPDDSELRDKLNRELSSAAAILDSMSEGAFSEFFHHEPTGEVP